MDSIFETISKAFSWLNSVLGPINEKINDALRERTDFDFAQTTLLPAILFVILGGIFAYLGWAPRAGLEALLTWVLYTSSPLPLLWLGFAIAVVLALCVLMLFGGHWLLLKLWMLVPLRRMSRLELPFIDHEGLRKSLAAARSAVAQLKDGQKAATDRAVVIDISRGADDGLAKSLNDQVDGCEKLTKEIEDAAAAIHRPAAKKESSDEAQRSQSEPEKAKEPDKDDTAGSTGKIFKDMIEGLRPGFLNNIGDLSAAVEKFQASCLASSDAIRKAVEKGSLKPELLDEIDAHLVKLDKFLTRVANAVTGRFKDDPWLQDDAPRPRTYRNSLAFNLAGTTLERWQDWGPVDKWRERLTKKYPPPPGTDFGDEEWRNLLDRLKKSRSSIVTYATVATAVVAIVLTILAAGFSMAGRFTNLGHWFLAVIVSAIVLAGTIVAIVEVFIKPIVAHAFYVSLVEGRIRNLLRVSPQGTTPGWFAASLLWLMRPFAVLGGIAAVAIVVIMPATIYWLVSGVHGLDNRLVIVAARDLAKNDGITRRNFSDVLDVAWQSCASPPAPWAEVSPARLFDTFLMEECKETQVLAIADLVVRPEGAAIVNPPVKGADCKGALFSSDPAKALPPPLPPMCRTTVNSPKPTKATPPHGKTTIVDVKLDPLIDVIKQQDIHTQESLREIAKSIDKLRIAIADIKVGCCGTIDIDAEFVAELKVLVKILIEFYRRKDPPQAPHYIGTVHFNFGCGDLDQDRACHRPTDKQLAASCKDVDKTALKADVSLAGLARLMDRIAAARSASPETMDVLVVGWADHAGSPELNQLLATARANKIQGRLEARFPTMKYHIHHVGMGEGNPDTDICDATRRRADIYLIRSQ